MKASSSTIRECPWHQMPDTLTRDIKDSCIELSVERRRYDRKIPLSLSPIDALQGYIMNGSYTLHKTVMPGILSLDIDSYKDIIATGGLDTNGIVFDKSSAKVISILEGHAGQVRSVKFVNKDELVVTGSADNTVRVWQRSENGSYECKSVLMDHIAEVQAVTVHPTNKYFVTASLDCTWKLYNLSDSHVAQVRCGMGSEDITAASFHPDGHIIATGTSHSLRFWDVLTQDNILKIDAHVGSVTSIAFSENGYLCATAAEENVKLWDLRFFKNFQTFPSDNISVDFDHSGSYLATGGSRISVYSVASAHELKAITTYPVASGIGNITSVKFGNNAKHIAAGSVHSSNLLIYSGSNDDC